MSRSQWQTPWGRIAAGAVLACGTTLSLAIVLPAQLASHYCDTVVMATDAATPVSIVPARIEVVVTRPQTTAKREVARQQS
jgi:hypothetical protein